MRAGTRRWRGEHGPDFAGADSAQRTHLGGAAKQLAQPVDRRPGRLQRRLRRQLGGGEQAVSFPACLAADLFGLAEGLEVVGQRGFDVFLAAQPGGVAVCLGLLGPAQGGRAG